MSATSPSYPAHPLSLNNTQQTQTLAWYYPWWITTMTCPKCKRLVSYPCNAPFSYCPYCGARLTCPHCGKPLGEDC